jgi:hypothetical protein
MQRTLAKNRRRDALWEVAERLREMIFCRWQPTRPYDIVLAFMTFPHRIASRRGGSYQRLEGSATAMYAKEMAYQEIKDTRILNQSETIWAFLAVNQDGQIAARRSA